MSFPIKSFDFNRFPRFCYDKVLLGTDFFEELGHQILHTLLWNVLGYRIVFMYLGM